ncbi:hypothetical protein ABT185_27125 [Streptomyces clavifer]|uniref:hypothetical protein n=1 Tax=Streptomyces clavifer TaxID=68188 RepID=UPI00331B0571
MNSLATLRRRSSHAVLAVTAGAVAITMGTPTAAQAAAPNVLVACTAAGQTNFAPGVQVFPLAQRVTYQGQDSSCEDNSGVGVASATISAGFHGVIISCLGGGFGTGIGSGTIEWTLRNGEKISSQINLEIDNTVLNTASVSGHVLQGAFQGEAFGGTFTTELFNGASKCTAGAPFGGVKNAAFTGQFSIG